MLQRLSLWSLFFIALILDLHRKGGGIKQEVTPKSLLFLMTSWIAVLCVSCLLETVRPKKLQRWLALGTAFTFAISFYYFKRVASPFSYTVLINNFEPLLDPNGLHLVGSLAYSIFYASDWGWSILFSVLIFFSYRWKPSPDWTQKIRGLIAGEAFVAIALVSLAQPYSYDPVTNFLKSAAHHYFPQENRLMAEARKIPIKTGITVKSNFPHPKKPNVFIILVESFNSRFTGQKNENGLEYTPFFNKLMRENFSLNKYFSNSIQTTKGHFAALCGQVPLIRGIEFENSDCFESRCLPELLVENNYETYFLQADPNHKYNDHEKFMLSHGIQELPQITQSCNLETDKCYGIGVADDIFYRRAFEYLNARETSGKPVFAAFATVANHMPFSSLSKEERFFYKNPQNRREHYLNSLHLTDKSFEVFFELFKKSRFADNTVLIITGDHGFPTGEHGSFHNENFAYQENFGVPFVVIDPREDLKKNFSAQENEAFSHLNLGATVMDLAGLSGPTDFIADSVFSAQGNADPIPLVQPYSGGYQSVIHWPYKYIYGEFRQSEQLFNLESDPEEKRELPLEDHQAITKKLRRFAGQIYRQQEVFSCQIPQQAAIPSELRPSSRQSLDSL